MMCGRTLAGARLAKTGGRAAAQRPDAVHARAACIIFRGAANVLRNLARSGSRPRTCRRGIDAAWAGDRRQAAA